jgi:hypothetical protein
MHTAAKDSQAESVAPRFALCLAEEDCAGGHVCRLSGYAKLACAQRHKQALLCCARLPLLTIAAGALRHPTGAVMLCCMLFIATAPLHAALLARTV